MTDLDTLLAPIRERLNAATPGPWKWSPEEDVWGDCGPNLETVERGPVYIDGSQSAAVTVIGSWGYDANGINVEDHDAAFIANAPTDQARLLAAIDAAETVAQRLEATGSHQNDYWARQLRTALTEALGKEQK